MAEGRVFNFAPGPACLPTEVLLEAQKEFLNFNNSGRSVMELSHRGKEFTKIHNQTKADLKSVLNIPDNYKILFLQGGGAAQFAAVPLNFCHDKDSSADYIVTGSFSKNAVEEAILHCKVNVAVDTEKTKFTTIPPQSEWNLNPKASYVYYCENETINGVRFHHIPTIDPSIPLVCDMSSSFLGHPVDVSKFGVIFAGAQKNAGIAGLSIVIIREDLLSRSKPSVPNLINYKKKADSDSLDNTPPVFNIYMTGLVLKWIKAQGGLAEIERLTKLKAEKVYAVIDSSNGFYMSAVDVNVRSVNNVTLRIKGGDTTLEDKFTSSAEKVGLVDLKGHRSVGGIRISLYNAMPLEGVEALVKFMKEFMEQHL